MWSECNVKVKVTQNGMHQSPLPRGIHTPKIVSEYDQEIPQTKTADNPMAPRGRATQPSRYTRKTNKAKQPALSLPHQNGCNTRTDIK